MAPTVMFALALLMLLTSFLSGIFGMAGGLILMGVLLVALPLPEAMALHAITQMTSNGWRGFLWLRYVRARAAIYFLCGSAIAFALWVVWSYVPDKPIALILLGSSPFLLRLLPKSWKPNPEKLTHGIIYGGSSMVLMLLAGVSGPLIDSYFLGGNYDRREIVATKAVCQVIGHAAKFAYFGALASQASGIDPAMAGIAIVITIVGTSLARPVLDRLSDLQYRTWANRIITVIAATYLARGAYLMMQ